MCQPGKSKAKEFDKAEVKKEQRPNPAAIEDQEMIQRYEEMAEGIVVTYYMQDEKWRKMQKTERYKDIGYDEWETLAYGCLICGFREGEEKKFWAHVKREHLKSGSAA
ncbi:hypothetical protein DIS24_g3541 [Lasiodiplodia hormozganensis]|uniref:Uncharacterized protein n=1 Tax=Lasiodiplodia hormozganensis TaxID=869390 RepID=A0AA40D389_9PEZI|nr:hypothetical protein DIS24_g3541 [Lasiodiplodia hormozganensis]